MTIPVTVPKEIVNRVKAEGVTDVEGFLIHYFEFQVGIVQGISHELLDTFFENQADTVEDFSQ